MRNYRISGCFGIEPPATSLFVRTTNDPTSPIGASPPFRQCDYRIRAEYQALQQTSKTICANAKMLSSQFLHKWMRQR